MYQSASVCCLVECGVSIGICEIYSSTILKQKYKELKYKRPTGLNGHLSVNCTCLICKSMQIMTIKNIYGLWVGILRALVWHVNVTMNYNKVYLLYLLNTWFVSKVAKSNEEDFWRNCNMPFTVSSSSCPVHPKFTEQWWALCVTELHYKGYN